MTLLKTKLIELKFEGYTYRQISEAVGGRPSEGYIKRLFARDGTLYIPYLEFQQTMSKRMLKESRKKFQKKLAIIPPLLDDMLQACLKEHKDRRALRIACEIADRAGAVSWRDPRFDLRVEEQLVQSKREELMWKPHYKGRRSDE